MSGFDGKYFHIAGSANAKTEPELIRFAHRVVQGVVQAIVRNGGGIVCAAGVEPRQDASVAGSPSLLFDWTVLSAAGDVFDHELHAKSPRPPIVVVVSEKAEQGIPLERRQLWNRLLRQN